MNNDPIYHEFLQVAELSRRFHYDASALVPKILLIGSQSSGKSRLLACIVQYPIELAMPNQATKCPIEYILVYSEDHRDTPYVTIQLPGEATGRDIPVQDLSKKLFDYMETLHGVSSEPVIVKFHYYKTVNLHIVDLPGFQAAGSPQYEDLWNLIDAHSANPNSIIVGIVRASDEVVTNNELPLITDRASIRGKKMIIVHNMIDAHAYGVWQHLGNLDIGHISNQENYFFTTLNPQNQNLDFRRNFDEKLAELQSLQEREEEWVKARIWPKLREYPAAKDRFLFKNVLNFLTKSYKEAIQQIYPRILDQLRDKREELCNEYTDIEERLRNSPPDHDGTDNLLNSLTLKFVEKLLGLVAAKAGVSYKEEGRGLFDEIRHVGGWDLLIDEAAFENIVQSDQLLYSDSKKKFLGFSSIDRLKVYVKLCLLRSGPASMELEDIEGICRTSSVNGSNNNPWNGIEQCVHMTIKKASGGAEWFSKVILSLFQHWCQICRDIILKEVGEDEVTSKLLHWITLAFIRERTGYLAYKLSILVDKWNESIDLYSSYLPVDLSVMSIMILLNCKMEDVIADKSCVKSPVEEPDPVLVGTQTALEERTDAKIENIKKVRSEIKKLQGPFTLADIAEGGLQCVFAGDAAHHKIAYTQAAAQEYYLLILNSFLLQFDAQYFKYFRQKFEVSNNISEIYEFLCGEVKNHPDYRALTTQMQVRRDGFIDKMTELEQEILELDTVCIRVNDFTNGHRGAGI